MARAVRLLSRYTGPTDEVSELWPFDSTDYYEPEMGENLERQFVSFERTVNPGELAHIKTLTNELEERICYECGLPQTQRRVNLDPGYISLGKLVLATTKDYAHRVFLRDGIYAESTLRWEGGRWVPWPWTYPDYADTRYHAFFARVRERYKAKLSSSGEGAETSKGRGL